MWGGGTGATSVDGHWIGWVVGGNLRLNDVHELVQIRGVLHDRVDLLVVLEDSSGLLQVFDLFSG